VEEGQKNVEAPRIEDPGHLLEAPPQPPSPPRKRRSILVWLILIALAAGGYYAMKRFGLHRTPPQASRLVTPGGVSLTVATARTGSIGVYLEAIGTVTPVYTASITAQVQGRIVAVHYKEGQLVRKGDPLIDIDPRPYEAQVLQAQGTLDRDLNVLAQSRMDLERFREAWARNAIPRQQLEDQEKIVLQNEGQVKSDQGNLNFLQVQLEWAHITAPFTGRVGLRLVDPGNVVVLTPSNQLNTTTNLVVLTQTQPITVVFTVAADNLGEARREFRRSGGLPVFAYDRTLETKIATGTLTAIDNQVDTTTGTVKLRATFDNSDDALFPNQFVNARLLVKTLHGVTLIPTHAIQHNGQATFVYVIRNGKAQMQQVKTGNTDAGMTAVQGIRPGTMVATSSFEKLQENVPVTIVKKPVSGKGEARTP
jgi:membrane fusion protein, multidrug efflux system